MVTSVHKREAGGSEPQRELVMPAAGFEDAGSGLKQLEKKEKMDFPLEYLEGKKFCEHLDFRTSDVQRCKRVNLYCFNPWGFLQP